MSKKLFYYGSTASFTNLHSNYVDGVNEAAIASSSSIFNYEYTQPFTVFCFAKLDTSGNGTSRALMVKQNSSGRGFSMFMGSDNTLRIILTNTITVFPAGTLVIIASTPTYTTNVWRSFAARSDGSGTAAGLSLFVNGVAVGTTTIADALAGNTIINAGSFAVGARSDLVIPFPGRIANPCIFNSALTAGTILNLHNAKMGNLATVGGATVQGAWNYPTGTAGYPTWNDYSGNSRNLTMTNQESGDINTDVPT